MAAANKRPTRFSKDQFNAFRRGGDLSIMAVTEASGEAGGEWLGDQRCVDLRLRNRLFSAPLRVAHPAAPTHSFASNGKVDPTYLTQSSTVSAP